VATSPSSCYVPKFRIANEFSGHPERDLIFRRTDLPPFARPDIEVRPFLARANSPRTAMHTTSAPAPAPVRRRRLHAAFVFLLIVFFRPQGLFGRSVERA
jgi:hypothetical protein